MCVCDMERTHSYVRALKNCLLNGVSAVEEVKWIIFEVFNSTARSLKSGFLLKWLQSQSPATRVN